MRLPYEIYLRFLIAKRHAPKYIIERLTDYGFIPPTQKQIKDVTSLMTEEVSVNVKMYLVADNKEAKSITSHEDFKKWLMENQIFELWQEGRHVRLLPRRQSFLKAIMEYRELRILLCQFLLLGEHDEETIADQLNHHFRANISFQDVVDFRKYLWNDEILTKQEWVNYISQIKDVDERRIYLLCLERSRQFDVSARLGILSQDQKARLEEEIEATVLLKLKYMTLSGAPPGEIMKQIKVRDALKGEDGKSKKDEANSNNFYAPAFFNSMKIEGRDPIIPSIHDINSPSSPIDIGLVRRQQLLLEKSSEE